MSSQAPVAKGSAQKKKEEPPKKEKKPQKDGEKKKKKEKAPAADEAKAVTPQRGFAVVKEVRSGDCLVLMGGGTDGRAAPEKTVFLQGINAPKLGRGREAKESPWGWHSREYLRKRVIGQKVSFAVQTSSAPRGDKGKPEKDGKPETPARPDAPRDFCIVTLPETGENLSEMMVKGGWATVKISEDRKPPSRDAPNLSSRDKMYFMQEDAEKLRLGMWVDKENPNMIRNVDWKPDARAIFQKYKGVPLPAIVDQVRDGSTLRCELLGLDETDLHHTMITLHLAGIQCPQIPRAPEDASGSDRSPGQPRPARKAAPEPEPFAVEAQQFTAARLLQRDVQVVIQGVDKFNNFFGTVLYPKGNITMKLVEHGLASVLPWSAAITPDGPRIKEAERQAKEARVKRWAHYVPSDEKEVHKEINGKVTQVVSGDSLVVKTEEGAELKYYLASVRAPRMGGPRGELGEPFGYEAREYVRKRLIGHNVKLVIEYYKKAPKEAKNDQERVFVSVDDGKGNLSMALLLNGLAQVIRHRLEEDRSMFYEEYQKAEEQSILEKKGMHAPGQHPVHRIQDLTQRQREAIVLDDGKKSKGKAGGSKANQFLASLKREPVHNAVVEHVFSGSRFKIFIPNLNCMVFFALSGVKIVNRKSDNEALIEFGNKALEYAKSAMLHQNVKVEVEDLDRGDNFLGTMWVGNKENWAVKLLQDGLAKTVPTRSAHRDELVQAEQIAKDAKLNIWSIEQDEENKEDDFTDEEFNVKVTDIVDGGTFYFTNVADPEIEKIQAAMKTFDGENSAPIQDPHKDLVCAALFRADNQWHRVRIIGPAKTDGEQRVVFIDFGNVDFVETQDLRELPEGDLRTLAGRARHGVLAGVRASRLDKERGQAALTAFQGLVWDQEVSAKVEVKTKQTYHLTLFTADKTNVNESLIRDGIVRVRSEKSAPFDLSNMIKDLQQIQEEARSNQTGIWSNGDISSDEEDAPRGRKGGANGQRRKR